MTAVFNLTVIRPDGYVHSDALLDVVDYLQDGLRRAGHGAVTSVNSLADGAINVVFGAHLLTPDVAVELDRYDTVVFNSEQLEDRGGWHLDGGGYARLLRRHPVWDYSARNLRMLANPLSALVPLGDSEALRRHGLTRRPGPDLLFYGSLTPRRVRLLEAIEAAGVPVRVLFGVYGAERNAQIMSSWAVLNLHKDDSLRMFEPVRCFYPLANRVGVISESFDHEWEYAAHADCVRTFDTAELVDGVAALYRDRARFDREVDAASARFATVDLYTHVAAAAHLALTAHRLAS